MTPNGSPWAVAGWGVALVSFLGLLVRSIGPWRKQISDMEATLRAELHSDIEKLKLEQAGERAVHVAELRAYQMERDELGDSVHRLETQLNRQQIRHNAERALDRHRLNNINACFDALLLLLKANPDNSVDAVKMIEEMRGKQLLAEAQEKAIIRSAEIAADEGETDHDGN